MNFGLVLTGGGARAAYQAGVMKGISSILGAEHGNPFQVITGISAGAINAAYLASRASQFTLGSEACFELWRNLKPQNVIHTDVLTMSRLGARWLRNLSLGGASPLNRATHLMDASPLGAFLQEKIDFASIGENIRNRSIHGFSVSATNYRTGTAVSFFEGDDSIEPWVRSSRIGRRSAITPAHVLASSSIPLVFEPVRLEDSYYGDGGIRLRTPLSPAIHLGSDRIVAIGIRYFRPEDMTLELNEAARMADIAIADIAGVMLNAAFMDSLESDVERLERINQTLTFMPEAQRLAHPGKLRIIPLLVIRPSQDLARLASDQFRKFPRMLRHLLRGIGASEERGWDLLSYLGFDSSYTTQLLELGEADAQAKKAEILEFFAPNARG